MLFNLDRRDVQNLQVALDCMEEKSGSPLSELRQKLADSPSDEAMHEECFRQLRRAYWDTVRAVAEDIEQHFRAGEIDDLADAIWETVDGSSQISMHFDALQTLLFSDNWQAIDDQGELPESLTDAITQAAFFAFHTDISEQLPAEEDMIEEAPEDDEDDEDEDDDGEDDDGQVEESEGDEDE